LKDNFSIIKAEDRQLLLEAKDEVEAEMNKKKWQLIADKVKQKGGDKYSVSCIDPSSDMRKTC
jgi:TRAP-type C4-dicarboxylate transport system substrate-binding protein